MIRWCWISRWIREKTCGFRNCNPNAFGVSAAVLKGAGGTPCHYRSLLFDALRVIIDLNAARLPVFALPSNLADVLRRGNARAGAARPRARDRLSVSAAHQLTPRIHRQVTRANSLCAATGNLKNPPAKREKYRHMAA